MLDTEEDSEYSPSPALSDTGENSHTNITQAVVTLLTFKITEAVN